VIDVQVDELRATGCQIIHQEHASGASRARPLMAKLMRKIGAGDVLVVVRLDRRTQQGRHPDRSCNGQPADKEAPARTSRLADRCCVQMRLPSSSNSQSKLQGTAELGARPDRHCDGHLLLD
jgi:hypothetical protein